MLQDRQEMAGGGAGKVDYTQNVIMKEMYLEIRNCQKDQLRDLRVVVSKERESWSVWVEKGFITSW